MGRGTCLALFIAALVGLGHAVQADTIVQVTSRAALGATDFVDWGTLGPAFTVVSNPFNINSNGGIAMTVSEPSGSFERFDQGGSPWNGDFAPGDAVLWTGGSFGPMTITFATPVSAVGAQIDADILPAPFNGFLTATAFSPSGANLGTFSLGGAQSNSNANTAPFIGIRDMDGANIASISFAVDPSGGTTPSADFAINMLSLDSSPGLGSPSVPLPNSAASGLLLMGLMAVATISRRFNRTVG